MSTPITLGYWNIHGLGSCIRIFLEYLNEEYVEKSYTVETPEKMAQWFDNDKKKLSDDLL